MNSIGIYMELGLTSKISLGERSLKQPMMSSKILQKQELASLLVLA